MGRVRRLSVDLDLNTARYFAQVDAAASKTREFGNHTSASMAQAGAAIRTIEGNFSNNVRAVERFLTSVLPLGPAIAAAFPLVGGIAFVGLLTKLSKEAVDFYRNIKNAAEATSGAFRATSAPLKTLNDELAVTNDRLKNDIDKLEGRRQNTLALMLDEARAAADRLADSLDKDLKELDKVLGDTDKSFWKKFFDTRDELTKEIGGESGFGGFRGHVAGINDAAQTRFDAISQMPRTTDAEKAAAIKAKEAAQAELNTAIQKAYGEEIAKVTERLRQAEIHREGTMHVEKNAGISGATQLVEGTVTQADIERVSGALRQLKYQQVSAARQAENTNLTGRKDADEAARNNRLEDKPFQDRMKMMGAQLEGLKAKLGAIGKGEEAQILAKTFGESLKIIEEVNKALERRNIKLTDGEKAQIKSEMLTIASTEADVEWRTKMEATSTSIESRIRSQEMLTAAIGKGYEATKAANVEARLMQELGQHANDPKWMSDHGSDVAALRAKLGRDFEAQHADQVRQATQKLQEQIELEKALAGAQMQGAEAVRQAALAVKLRQMATEGATKAQMQAEIELYNAQRSNVAAGDVSGTMEKVSATERLTAATLKGAAAVRQANLENKLAAIERDGPSSVRGSAAIVEDRTNKKLELAQAAAHADRVQQINDEIEKLTDAKTTLGDTLAIEISLRDLENQRIKALAEESLQLRGAKDGVRAFFIEMQQDAKSTASIVYDALHSALDRSSENMAKMLTEKKPKGGWSQEWAKEFQGIGEQMTQSSIKSLAQKGLGELGKLFGVDLGGKKPDGTAANPLWVRLAGAGATIPGVGGAGGSPGAIPGVPPLFGGAGQGGIFSIFKNFFKGGGAAAAGNDAGPAIDSLDWGGFMADGGDVYPGKAYTVGERGQETFVPRTAGAIVPAGGRAGTVIVNNNVDARGADLGAHNRLVRGLELTHKASVASAVQATHERSRRVPRGN